LKDTGPKIFLRRLLETGIDISNIELLNPSLEDVNNRSKSKKILIGRLDGTSYYDFSTRNLQNFLALRNYNKISKVVGALPLLKSSRISNRLFNRYLDRTCSWLITNADGLVFQSKISLEMHKTFLNFDVSSKPYRIINNGVDVDLFSPGEQPSNSFGFPSVIISASHYRLHKRLQEAVKLVNYLSAEFPKIRLNVVGEMDLLTSRCVKKLDTSRCNFHGRISPKKLPYFYKNADIQLHLSIFDPCPNVVVEGLASGLPVITPLESGAQELVGMSNFNWVVAEQLNMRYMELHREEKIPNINLETYSNVFIKIFDNLKANQNSARARAEDSLDIRQVAKQYQQFFDKMKEDYDE
jgi:glycosyltransferase involved in cell wall biosynthesis